MTILKPKGSPVRTSSSKLPEHELLESSIGHLGDVLFLDYRFAIIRGTVKPGQRICIENLSSYHSITTVYAKQILEALAVHHYVERSGLDYVVTHWTDDDIKDLISATSEMQTALGLKFAERKDPQALERMRQTVSFDFSDPIPAPQLEAFHIRWWSFFHQMLGAYKVANFRTINLTTTPAYLRRRMINGLSSRQLVALHHRMKQLLGALETNNVPEITRLYQDQIDVKLAGALADNQRYASSATTSEIDYSLSGPPLPYPDDRPPISRGYREPLEWADYLRFQFT